MRQKMLELLFPGIVPRPENGCPICGSNEFQQKDVIGEELMQTWQITGEEVEYINRQQGHICVGCNSNLRSRTLAVALMERYKYPGVLRDFCTCSRYKKTVRLLELNTAGSLSPWLKLMLHHKLASYPEVDMQNLPFTTASWDVVIHSDVLEHVSDPLLGLSECHRVLMPGGVLIYTIPIVHGRLTRQRQGFPPSYHGAPGETRSDWMVRTEYGADFWLQPLAAGFRSIQLITLSGADSLAITCIKDVSN